ncbi:phage baseplate assembly protein V, partial [Campylobacter jejuni]
MNELGIICDIKDNKAKVAIGDMVTDFLSVFQSLANSYAVSFSPLRIGEQVLVIPVRGDLNSGVILRGLYQEKHRAKNIDENTFNIDFEDGTHLEYNSKSST